MRALFVRSVVIARAAEQDSGELVALVEQLIQGRLEVGVAYGKGTISVLVSALSADEGGAPQQLFEEGGSDAFGSCDDRIGVDEVQVEVAPV
jgi:hypothetical protein